MAAVRKPEEVTLIMLHYRMGLSKRKIAKMYKVSEGLIRQQLQVAEGFVDGCLAMAGAVLEMDAYTQKIRCQKSCRKILVRYAKTLVTC